MGGVIRLNQTLKMYRESKDLQAFFMGGRQVWKKPLRSMYPSRLVGAQDEVLFVGSSDIGCLLAATWSPNTHGWFNLFRTNYTGTMNRRFEGVALPGVGAAVTYGRISTPTVLENARNNVYDQAVNPFTSLGNYDTLVIDTSDVENAGLLSFPNASDYWLHSRMAPPYSFYDYRHIYWMGHEFEARMELLRMCSDNGVRKLFLMTPWPRLYPASSGLQNPAGDQQWFDRFFQNLEDSMHYQQDRLNAQIEFEGLTTHVTLVPMHLMIKRICEEILEGTAPAALTSVRKLFAHENNLSTVDPLDDTQPKHWYMLNYYGAYAINCLWAAIAYKADPRGLPRTDGRYTVDAESATFFQNIAWDIAQTYGRAGQTRSNPGYTMPKLRNQTPSQTLGTKLLLHAENMEANTPVNLARSATAKQLMGVIELNSETFPTGGYQPVIALRGATNAGPVVDLWNDGQIINFDGGYSDGLFGGERLMNNGLRRTGPVTRIYFDLVLPHADNPRIHGTDITALTVNLDVDHLAQETNLYRLVGNETRPRAMSPISNRALALQPTDNARVLDLVVSEEFITDAERAAIMRYFTRKYRSNGFFEPVTPDLMSNEVFRPQRALWLGTTRIIQSGHSLTDDIFEGTGWPGFAADMLETMYPANYDYDTSFVKSTMPGSPTWIRWNQNLAPKHTANRFDVLVMCERGIDIYGVARPDRNAPDYAFFLEDLAGELNYTLNQIDNGRDNKVFLYSTWPGLDGSNGEFNSSLADYTRRYKHRADYLTWKAHQMRPDLPNDWRVWIIPGTEMIIRMRQDIASGLVPGMDAFEDLFDDNIHLSLLGGFAMLCLHLTVGYGRHLGLVEDFPEYPEVPQAFRQYAYNTAWDIALTYEPCGLGGLEGAEADFDPADGDHLPNYTFTAPVQDPLPGDDGGGGGGDPDPEEPEDPPPATGTTLLWEATDLVFDGTGSQQFVMPTALQGGQPVYVILRATLGTQPGNESVLLNLSTQAEMRQKAMVLIIRSDLNAMMLDNDPGGNHAGVFPVPAPGTPMTIEAWIDSTGAYLDGFGNGPQSSLNKRPSPHTCPRVTIGEHEWGMSPVNGTYHGIRIYQGIPTAAQRAEIQAWANGLG